MKQDVAVVGHTRLNVGTIGEVEVRIVNVIDTDAKPPKSLPCNKNKSSKHKHPWHRRSRW